MNSPVVVVIEDNADFAAILETVLRMWGAAVERYDTLRNGRGALRRTTPSMLILDGQLPDGEGIDLYHELRAQKATRDLPILLLSVSDDVFQAARAMSGRDRHLFVGLKPMPLDEIQAIVEQVLRR